MSHMFENIVVVWKGAAGALTEALDGICSNVRVEGGQATLPFLRNVVLVHGWRTPLPPDSSCSSPERVATSAHSAPQASFPSPVSDVVPKTQELSCSNRVRDHQQAKGTKSASLCVESLTDRLTGDLNVHDSSEWVRFALEAP